MVYSCVVDMKNYYSLGEAATRNIAAVIIFYVNNARINNFNYKLWIALIISCYKMQVLPKNGEHPQMTLTSDGRVWRGDLGCSWWGRGTASLAPDTRGPFSRLLGPGLGIDKGRWIGRGCVGFPPRSSPPVHRFRSGTCPHHPYTGCCRWQTQAHSRLPW